MNIIRISACLTLTFFALLNAEYRMPKIPQGYEKGAPRKKLAYERNKEESERAKKEAAFEEKQKTRKRRKRQVNPRLKTKRVTVKHMDEKQLRAAVDRCKKENDLTGAAIFLEKLINDSGRKAQYVVEFADLLFDQKNYDEASKKYNEFLHVNPGNEAVEHASYRAIICTSKGILSPDRDQTKTEETLELANKFLERGDIFTNHRDEVLAIKQLCLETLAASELSVGAYSIVMGDYHGAQRRLAYARTEWLPQVPNISTTLAALEENLSEKFPEFKPATDPILSTGLTIAATKPTKKIDLTTRF